MKEIKLTRGKVALVDDEDFEELNKYKWCTCKKRHTFYAVRRTRDGSRKGRIIYMHRQILGFPKKVDHRDGCGTHNQKNNLRVCTNRQNHMNSRPRLGCSSKFKGVTFFEKGNKWLARLVLEGKSFSLGLHATEEDAALAYNRKAIEIFGEFARLNIIT